MERAVLLEFDHAPAEFLPLLPGSVSRAPVLPAEPFLTVLQFRSRLGTQGIGLGLHSLALSGELGPTAVDALLDRLPLRRAERGRLPAFCGSDQTFTPDVESDGFGLADAVDIDHPAVVQHE